INTDADRYMKADAIAPPTGGSGVTAESAGRGEIPSRAGVIAPPSEVRAGFGVVNATVQLLQRMILNDLVRLENGVGLPAGITGGRSFASIWSGGGDDQILGREGRDVLLGGFGNGSWSGEASDDDFLADFAGHENSLT